MYRAFLAWISDVYLGKHHFYQMTLCSPKAAVCFWTVFTALSVQLFYWSVWKLGGSGCS